MAEPLSGEKRPAPSFSYSPPRRGARKAFLAVAAILSLALVAGSSFSIASIHYAESRVRKVETGAGCQAKGCLPHVDPYCVRKVCNFLVLGSDSRAGLSPGQQTQFGNAQSVLGQRSDTIIVVNVDPTLKRTVVLSIPRDLMVEIPGHGMNKINEAFDFGADVMVQTVERLTGLKINHYMEVNFTGFERLVNALGGVPICIDRPLKDTLAGLRLPHAGCYNLYGADALAFVRARHVEGDTIPDFSRISRQQQFIRAVIQKVLSAGSVFQLPALVRAAEGNILRDSHLSLYALQDLTRKLATVGQEGVAFRVVPSVPVDINGVSYVQMVQPRARILFYRIRQGRDLGSYGKAIVSTPISPAQITIRLLDAGSGGKAQQVQAYLQKAGFVVLPVAPAPANITSTRLLYGEGRGKQEAVVSSYLATVPVVFDAAAASGADVTVVIGSDFKGIEG
jgi:LCP family protein required for cell wall assembly